LNVPNKKPIRTRTEVVHLPKLHADLPTLPEAFSSTEYDGWLVERIKRFQLKTYQKTQTERIAVLRQINELQTQCLAINRNENDWKHFAQEDRLRQKRLDIQEIELDMQLEELRERRIKSRAPVIVHKPELRDPMREALLRLRNKLRTGIEARSECDRLKQEYPAYAAEIEREFRKMMADMREDS
jgi:hypothetical protein